MASTKNSENQEFPMRSARSTKVSTLLSTTSILSRTALAMALGLISAGTAQAEGFDNGQFLAGNGTDTRSGNVQNITLGTSSAVMRADVNVIKDFTVNISGGKNFLVKDPRGVASTNDGTINYAGNLFIFNPAGMIIGATGSVNAGSFVVTTADIDNDKFMAGNYSFTTPGNSDASIINKGSITASQGGLVALVAPGVRNDGIITAGTVQLASANTVAVDMYGDGLYSFALDGKVETAAKDENGNTMKSAVENNGKIVATGGHVFLTANAAKGIVDNVINNTGIIEATAAHVVGGEIVLDGGSEGVVTVAGTLNASGKGVGQKGGSVTVKGENIQLTSATIDASGTNGGGVAKVVATQNVHVDAASKIDVSAIANGNGGSALVYGANYAVFNGTLLGQGGALSGNGGFAEISGGESVGFNGLVDLSAANGEMGTLLIDPKNLTISTASTSGIFADLISGGNANVNINDQALANTLRNSNVKLWATETLSTGSDIDLSTWETSFLGFVINSGITNGNLTLAAPVVNLLNDIILGNGQLNVADISAGESILGLGLITPPHDIVVGKLNLDGKIYTRNTVNGPLALAGDGQINTTANSINVLSNEALIQQAIQFADASDAEIETVNIGDGTFNESLTVDRSLTVNGTGTTNTTIIDGVNHTGNGVLVAANDVSLNGFIVRNFNNGIAVDSEIENLSMNDIVSEHNAYAGFHVSNQGGIDGLEVSNSHFDNNDVRIGSTNDWGYGWYIAKGDNNLANTTTVTNVEVTNTSFSGNSQKGIYAEKLDNATFTNVDVINSGTLVDSAFGNAGIDINLKNGTYADITFDNLTVTGSGVNSTVPNKIGNAVTIKARNDGATYSATPASLTGLTITNSTVTAGGDVAVAIGNNVDGATVSKSTITGPEALVFFGGVKNAQAISNVIHSTGLSSRGAAYGINFAGTVTGTATDNTVTGTAKGKGIWAVGGSNITVGGADVADGNSVSGFINGIEIDGATGTTLVQNNLVTGNTDSASGRAASDWQTGIGIFLQDVTGLVDVLNNTASGNTDGIRIQDMDPATRGDVTVARNTTNNNQDKGIILKRSDNIEVLENIVNGNAIGIYADRSSNALIKANDINGSIADGIRLRDGSNGVDIENNWIHGSGGAGVYVDNSLAAVSGVTIYDNSFAEANGSEANAKNIINTSGNTVNASFNWFGSTDEATVASKITGSVDISPYQGLGVDQQPATAGYQGSLSNLYVTDAGAQTKGLIQEAIDLAVLGGTVNVNAGTYTENLMIDKGLKLNGLTGATLQYDSTLTSGRGLAGNLITVTADNVNIDPLVFDGLGLAAFGINATGADNLVVEGGNIFQGFTDTNIRVTDSNFVRIRGNTFHGGQKGVFGDDVIDIQVNNNTFTGATVAGVHIINSNGTGYGGGANDVDIWSNIITSAAGATGVLVENSAYATIGWHPTNPFANALTGGNTITGGAKGVVVNNSANAYVAHNKIDGSSAFGIETQGSTNGTITQNVIGDNAGTGSDAIHISSNAGTTNVTQNDIFDAGWDGVNVTGSGGFVNVEGNDIQNTLGASGIAFYNFGGDGQALNNNINGADRLGIYIGNANGLEIVGNSINDTGREAAVYGAGIHAEKASNLLIADNTITNTAGDGINIGISLNPLGGPIVATSGNVIRDNSITNAGDDGIDVRSSDGAQITGNTITTALNHGILSIGSNNVTIAGNDIDFVTLYDAIRVTTANTALIQDNTTNHTGRGGIWVDQSSNVTIDDNEVRNAGQNETWSGIVGNNNNTITVTNNFVDTTSFDGIHMGFNPGNVGAANTNVTIDGNTVQNALVRGIYSVGGTLSVSDNTIGGAGVTGTYFGEGIFVENSPNVLVDDNSINRTGGHGIRVANSVGTDILNNEIGLLGGTDNIRGDGIRLENSNDAVINRNTVEQTFATAFDIGSGIHSINSNNVMIGGNGGSDGNTIRNIDWDGVKISGGNNVTVRNNDIDDVVRVGIYARDFNGLTIRGNEVTNTTTGLPGYGAITTDGGANLDIRSNDVDFAQLGILVNGAGGTNRVRDNAVNSTSGDGIQVNNTTNLTVSGNLVGLSSSDDNIGGDGIEVRDSDGAQITNNQVRDAAGNGIYNNSSDNTTISGNSITSVDGNGILVNPSFNVDVLNNTINGAVTGVQILAGGTIDVIGNSITNVTNGVTASGVNTLWIDNNNIDHNPGAAPAGGAYGIHVVSSHNVTIGDGNFSGNAGNNIDDFATAIHVGNNTGYTRIDGNDITDVNAGIFAVNTAGLSITDNDIDGRTGAGRGSDDGIHVEFSNGAIIGGSGDGNTVRDFAGNGIELIDSANALINSNTVYNVGLNGVFVDPSPATIVSFNDIYNTGANGIYILDSDGSQVLNNTIGTSAGNFNINGDGVLIVNSDNTQVKNNQITNTKSTGFNVGSGVQVLDSDGVLVQNNEIWDTDWDGVRVAGGSDNVTVRDNDISDVVRTGIYLGGVNTALVLRNDIDNAHDYFGVHVDGGSNITVEDNWIDSVELDGIFAENVTSPLVIKFNDIGETGGNNNIGRNGIYVSNSDNAVIFDNDITQAVENGILVNPSDNVEISHNDIWNVDQDGIRVDGGNFANIHNNDIENTGDDAIDVNDNDHVVIASNDIYNTGGRGIEVSDSYNADIHHNDIDETDSDAIQLTGNSDWADIYNNRINRLVGSANTLGNGIEVLNADNVEIEDNQIDDVTGNGIYTENSSFSGINGNTITDAGENGIYVNNGDYSDIFGNDIEDVANHGIFVNPTDFIDIAYNVISNVGNDGIHIDNGIFAEIWENTISGAGNDGIDVNGNFAVEIDDNDIANVDDNGIEVSDSRFAEIDGNRITGAGNDGIQLLRSDDAEIDDNLIYGQNGGFFSTGAAGAGRDGIHVEDSDNVEITDNIIRGGNAGFLSIGGNGANRDGIHVVNSRNADIIDNTVEGGSGFIFGLGGNGAGDDGIFVWNSDFADINGNDISDVGDDGIDVRSSYRVDIFGNDIADVNGDGIQVRNSSRVDIAWNDITGAGDDGIDVENSSFANIVFNRIAGVVNNGIEVEDSFAADVLFNQIAFTGDNGIYLNDSDYADVRFNLVNFTADNGIFVDSSENVDITNNLVAFTGDDGVFVRNSDGAEIAWNIIGFTGDDGVDVRSSDDVEIRNNLIGLTSGDGVQVRNSNDVLVSGNFISFVADDGIDIENGSGIDVTGNIVTFAANNGIEIENSDTIFVDGNFSSFNGEAGIFIDPSSDITVSNNWVIGNDVGIELLDVTNVTVSNNFAAGNTFGAYIDNATGLALSNNQFIGNDVGVELRNSNGATFTGDIFTNNLVGIRLDNSDDTFLDGVTISMPNVLDPAFNPLLDPSDYTGIEILNGSGGTRVHQLVIDGGDIAILIDGVGSNMQFVGGHPTGDESIFSNMNYYFVLQNGAQIDDSPLDASRQTFDGINPIRDFSGQSNAFVSPLLAALEAKTIDADDGFAVGDVFYWELPNLDINMDEFQRERSGLFRTALFSYAGKTIENEVTEAPNTFEFQQVNLSLLNSGTQGNAALQTANFFANLTPAAGGNQQQLASLEPSAGANGAQFAGLEPSAGANCGNSFLGGGFAPGFSCSVQ
jgi:parallel beta-helix repeat protein